MVIAPSYRLVICVGLLSVFLLASPAFADDDENSVLNSTCPEGEEQTDQGEPKCCMHNLIIENEEGTVCAEQPSDMSVAVALTLILSFTFLISLQCFMQHSDEDMREYAYTVISQTVSIFSAVLAFQSFDGALESFIIDPLQKATGSDEYVDLIVEFIHFIVWYNATQLTMAYVSCALKSDAWRRERLQTAADADPDGDGEINMMLHVEINCVSYGMVLAHLTGFAAINFWTHVQQMKPFNESPKLALVTIPVALLAQLIFERITDICRSLYIGMDGNKDWFENMWDKKCQEAEDDIMGLTQSVLIVNSLRYFINEKYGENCLPNSEQKEEGPTCKFDRSIPQVLWLLGSGLVFVIVLFLAKFVFIKLSQLQEEKDEVELGNSSRRDLRRGSTCHGEIREVLEKVRRGEVGDQANGGCGFAVIVERMESVILTICSMAYSWCIFHGTHELLVTINPEFLGQPNNATTLAVVLAFGVTYIAFVFIRILDRIADLPDEWTSPEVDNAIKTVISAMSIFIGFSWEQTFDESISQLAERTRIYGGRHVPAIARVVIGSGCIGVVFCSWQWFILPFVFRQGWRFGYIFSRKDLLDRCHELARHDPHFSLEHLQNVAHRLADKEDEYKRRFSQKDVEDEYKSLPSSEVEAISIENQELKLFTRVLEQQLAEERRGKGEAVRTEIRQFVEQERRNEVEGMHAEIQELKSQTKFLEQQIEERNIHIEAMHTDFEALHTENQALKVHTSHVEEKLVHEIITDFEEMQTELQDLKSQTKFLEQELEERNDDIEAMQTEHQELNIHIAQMEHKLVDEICHDVEAMQTEIDELKMQLADERRAGTELARLLAEERARHEEEFSGEELDEETQEQFKNRWIAERFTWPKPIPMPVSDKSKDHAYTTQSLSAFNDIGNGMGITQSSPRNMFASNTVNFKKSLAQSSPRNMFTSTDSSPRTGWASSSTENLSRNFADIGIAGLSPRLTLSSSLGQSNSDGQLFGRYNAPPIKRRAALHEDMQQKTWQAIFEKRPIREDQPGRQSSNEVSTLISQQTSFFLAPEKDTDQPGGQSSNKVSTLISQQASLFLAPEKETDQPKGRVSPIKQRLWDTSPVGHAINLWESRSAQVLPQPDSEFEERSKIRQRVQELMSPSKSEPSLPARKS